MNPYLDLQFCMEELIFRYSIVVPKHFLKDALELLLFYQLHRVHSIQQVYDGHSCKIGKWNHEQNI